MLVVEAPPTTQRAPAKGRILDTANALFYEDGIRNVGVDRIISASAVTKATFYKHYRAKDNLIVEYINARHERVRADIEAIIATEPDARSALAAFVASIVPRSTAPDSVDARSSTRRPSFRNPSIPCAGS